MGDRRPAARGHARSRCQSAACSVSSSVASSVAFSPCQMPVPPARPRAQTTRPPSPAKPTTQEVGSAERKRPATLGPSLCGQTRTTAPRHTQLFSCRPPDPDTPIGDAPTTASLPQHGVQHRHRLSSAQHQFRAGAPPRRDGYRLVVSPDGCSTRTVICTRSVKPSFS